ncbi:PTS N-acetylgalactosamine transporter subunit IIA [Vibrio sp. MACH09]|uniref:PTS galactosamine/N-acetylgalactosamine transporter subunit IIA n=1 Tax=unclassified Vibrio TaxID=2614977 RepID=UPI0014934E88|nr:MULTISPECIES: PTS galactosamine/N-acetylgalactosamine transporter subunit IIA [unclassified Vibrio]NOI67049.1 PTS sugar transporter subunit IIA [Vibrio sp. 99-8-1]GLO63583.1 PTS N-acetylgalactosamine transporter subunit IIA [Vibrio sp. MACH09]
MIAVILSGHGGFASGLAKAIAQIVGEQPQFRAIDFPVEMTTPQLEQAMKEAMSEIDSAEGIVFLTDLLGGTPFRTASLLSQQRDDIEVITGTNLQMVAEMLLERDELNLVEFRDQALEAGHRGMTSLAEQMSNKQQQEIEADGI